MMRYKLISATLLLAAFGASGCSAFRPMLFWRDTLIVGKTRLTGSDGAPLANTTGSSITVNVINLGGRIEDSLLSVQTDALGAYRSPELVAGEYTLEAMLPGFVIARASIEVKGHEHKRVDFELQKIGEAEGLSLQGAEEQNIPTPGEVKISPPGF